MARNALQLLTGTLTDLVKPLGASYESVRSWAQGRRTLPPKAAHRLVALMRQRADALTRKADELETELERGRHP